MGRFKMPPLDPEDPSSLQYALDQVELFLNSFAANTEAYLLNGPEQNLKVIRGIVDTAGSGTISEGSGFTISARTGTGDLTLAFTTAFSDVPAVTVTPEGTPSEVRYPAAVTGSAVRVQLFASGGAATDGKFHFIAIGPA